MAPARARGAAGADSLLVELLTEELPPKSLMRLARAFGDGLLEALRARHFTTARSRLEIFATPRRLAARVSGVLARQPDRTVERRGPAVRAALDADGKPTQALLGFARSCGVAPAKLARVRDDKGEYFVYRARQQGEPLARHLAGMVEEVVRRLPAAKLMRWGDREVQFVRPVHGLMMLHGGRVVPGEVLGHRSGNRTRGHRFQGRATVTVRRAQDYEKTLRAQAGVIASFEARRETIVRALERAAAKLGGCTWRIGRATELLDEVTSIVESPSVHAGAFDPAFLEVPRECLIVSMQQHQKYFALADADGRLQPRFLFVANVQPRDPGPIIAGNERVLRARLADARFFYDQDRRIPLAERVPRLAHVVYHNKLGSQLERVGRLQALAVAIARMLGADAALAERAAYLSKADLLTDMVGEFPELQGIMGRYYAEHDGEPPEVAQAIAQHYLPRAAGGELPRGPIALSVALADKLETLGAIFAIGLAPTGEKDPYGLRRAAVGLLRILVEERLALDLAVLFERTREQREFLAPPPELVPRLLDFVYERLRAYLRERDWAADEIEAVLALRPTRLDRVLPRLEALRRFRAAPEGQALAAANKRIQNILRQAGDGDPDRIPATVDGVHFREDAEKELARQLREAAARVAPLTAAGDFAGALKALSGLRGAVDAFFDQVLVMTDDPALRAARLQLLASIRQQFREIADVSKLQG